MKAFRYFVLFAITALLLGALIQPKADALSGNGGGSGSGAVATPIAGAGLMNVGGTFQLAPTLLGIACNGTTGPSGCGFATGTSIALVRPSNSSSTGVTGPDVNGRVMVAVVSGTGLTGAPVMAAPAGWTQLSTTATDNAHVAISAWQKTAGGTDNTTSTYTFTSTNTGFMQGYIVLLGPGTSVLTNGVALNVCVSGTTCAVAAPSATGNTGDQVITYGFGSGTATLPGGEALLITGTTNGFAGGEYTSPATSQTYSFSGTSQMGGAQIVID